MNREKVLNCQDAISQKIDLCIWFDKFLIILAYILIFVLAQLIVKMSYVYVNYSESLILSSLQSWIEVLDIYLILKKHPSKKLLVKAGSSNFFILLINQIFLQGM